MEEELLSKLIEFIEKASPQVWAIARRQVLVVSAQTIWWGILTSVSCTLLIRLAINQWKAYKEDKCSMNDFFAGSSVFVAVCLGIAACILWNSLIGLILNPQYYAISILINLVK